MLEIVSTGMIESFVLKGTKLVLTVRYSDMMQDMSVIVNENHGPHRFALHYGAPLKGWKAWGRLNGEDTDLYKWLKTHGHSTHSRDIMDAILQIWLDRYWPPEKGEARELNAKSTAGMVDPFPCAERQAEADPNPELS